MSELEFRNVTVRFGRGRNAFTAVDNVSFAVPAGRIVGLVGESGSGKSTVARVAVGLCEPVAGSILLGGEEISHARGAAARLRRTVQMVFQDPYACLDPRRTIGQSLAEALETAALRSRARLTRSQSKERIAGLLQAVKLPPERAQDLPDTLSGGQRQRVALARVLAAEPQVILADEITSALDVSVQGSVLNLLKALQGQMGFSMLFISHNLAVVRYLCDDVVVMKSGLIVEQGSSGKVLNNPSSDYTQQLLAAVPQIGRPLFESTQEPTFTIPVK
ncbi:ABC transporter ATP-binding protein [Arthrobacter sp. 4R501]|uniref:ABC transporter ATP-binding protein n=1 Tax=Arthrobacter sp. 4R501 TaxID=2058886 RepID=UPI000CE52D4F|nr:ATP-binding cassette domain-containing protein [Arthrobacter sp. 4R501]